MIRPFFWLPFSIILFVLWLLLSQKITIGTVMMGILIATSLSVLSFRLRPDLAFPRRYIRAIELIFIVFYDLLISNFDLIKQILKPGRKQPKSGFINVTLSIRDPHGLSFLACIITFTPGTIWSGLNEENYILRLHVLNIDERDSVLKHIKIRYEKRLMEIFE